MYRRLFLATLASGLAAAGLTHTTPARAQSATGPVKELRIGYQKSGVLLVAKQQKLLEQRFADRGIAVRWVEFSFGPPLLEALNAGSIDYGTTGDAPPVFAQAARANLVYVAAIPARGDGQAIIVPADSPIKTAADLKGHKLGFAKASSAHNLAVAALDDAGLAYTDVTPVYLPPADAAAAFARGAIDAWSIWDPYYAIAEQTRPVRVLPLPVSVTAQNTFFLANRSFTTAHPDIVAGINDALAAAARWTDAHRAEAATLFSEATGVDPAAQKRTVDRSQFNFVPLDDTVITQQQAVADRFFKLGLIPKPVTVREIVWAWKPGV